MTKDLISIIIPIYDVEPYLKRCLDSVVNQTYQNIEIILINDGSPDNCPRICDEYKLKDSRIKVIHQENGGLSAARNAGLELMTGKYVTFIDSDDYVEKDYVEFLYNLVLNNDAEIGICAYTAIYDSGRKITQAKDLNIVLSPKYTLEKMLYHEDFNVAACAKIYKAELFDNIRFSKNRIFEDVLTTYLVVDKAFKIAIDLKSKYNYMIRDNSIMTSKFSLEKLSLIDAYKSMGDYILNKYPDLEKAVTRSIIYANISVLRQMIYSKPRYIEKEKEIRKTILQHRKKILRNERVPKRDKIAIIILMFGRNIFRYAWNIYCKSTGRS